MKDQLFKINTKVLKLESQSSKCENATALSMLIVGMMVVKDDQFFKV